MYILEDEDKNQLRIKSDIISSLSRGTADTPYSNLVPLVLQARDKALFSLSKMSRTYELVWFIEYDVYIPSRVRNMAIHDRSDLVVTNSNEIDRESGLLPSG
jgi:hypothetical protein